ncbi:MAG TPA: hypothetical protein VJ385_05245 [Fibrobacteria bacterium]|nr:hypothetical protein [Fibrobacteria bacterium]
MSFRFRLAVLGVPALLALCACGEGTVHIVRYPSGEIRELWTEKDGKKNGAASAWDAEGRLRFKGEYENGFLVRETRYDAAGKASPQRRFAVRSARVKAVGSAGDSLTVEETCAWSEEPGRKPVRHGLCDMRYADGKPMASRYYRSGRLHGPVKAWYPDGTPWLDGSYDEGVPAGRWRTWTRAGNPLWSGAYSKGEKDGDWEEWFPDGGPRSKSAYRLGQPQGGYQEWYPSGKPRLRGEFQAGRREGRETAWYPDGARLYSARYAAGSLDGDFHQWHPSGRLRLHCRFAQGRKVGASRVWYENGVLQEQAYYRDGRLNGPYRTWSPEGAPMAMKEFRDGTVAFDSKAKELLDLLGADRLRVPVGMMGFYWGMGARECRANLGLYQASEVRADSQGINARLIAFPDRRPTQARIRLSFNAQGELWGIRLDLLQGSSGDFFPLCENLEIEIGAALGTAGLRKGEGREEYTMTRKREWGRFTVTTASAGGIRQDLPVLSAEGSGPAAQGWFRFSLENHLYREYADPANTSITPPRWREDAFLAGR